MHPSIHKNIDAFFSGAFCATSSATAGGAGDGTEVDGAAVDTQGYDSVSFVLGFTTTLAQDETLSFTALTFQQSDDGAVWDAEEALASDVIAATGGTGGTTEIGASQFHLATRGTKRYVRINYTPVLSAGATDTASIAAVAARGGAAVQP